LRDFSMPDAILVGDWQALRATGELSRGATTERLEPKVMNLLFLLAGRPSAVFTKDEIMAAVWPGVIVGEDTLARAVSRLRKPSTMMPRHPPTSRRCQSAATA
jgi:transcriptional activator of cad operon